MAWPLHLDRPLRPWPVALVVFVLAGIAASSLVWHAEQHNRREERARVAYLALNHASTLQRNIENALSATYALAALVRQGRGEPGNFDAIAKQLLPFYPGVAALALAPGGVVQRIVPLAGNEDSIGHDMLRDPARSRESVLARDSGQLTLAGPFDLVQGGQGAVGRLPVFLDDAKGHASFWGFTTVLIRFPEVLEVARLSALTQQNYRYELWRVHPDTGAKHIIAASSSAPLSAPVTQPLRVPNATWNLSLTPVNGWGDALGLAFNAALGLLVSLLLAYVAKLLVESRVHERGLEVLVAQRTFELQVRTAELQNFRAAMDASADAIYLVDRASMRFIDVNAAACRLQGQTREELLALGPAGALSMSNEELARIYDSIIAGGAGTEPVELRPRRANGKRLWIEVRSRAQQTGAGWVIVATARDITERKRSERALRESAQELRLFADNVPAMTSAFDNKLRLLFVNKRYADFFGYSQTHLVGKHLREILGEETYREVEGYFAQVLRGQPVTYERTGKLPGGALGYLEIRLLPHIGEEGKVLGCFAVTTDITEHKRAEERIQRVAHHDALTALPNRLLFNDRLQQAISLARRDAGRFALLYLDLDNFKPVNDKYGHATGDELLRAVAARLRREVRESDTVARVGGDEFAMILSKVARADEAEVVAAKIIAAVTAPFPRANLEPSVTIGMSIGIALYPGDGASADALVKAADTAMYHAKQVGNSVRLFTPAA